MRIAILLGCLGLIPGLSQATPLTPDRPDESAKSPGTAHLIIKRDSDLPQDCVVEVQPEELATAHLPTDQSLNLAVPAGEFTIRVEFSRAPRCTSGGLASSRSILIGPGETQHYRVMLGDQALFLAPQPD